MGLHVQSLGVMSLLLALWPGDASALPGRTNTVDLMNLAQLSGSYIDAASPGFNGLITQTGAFGFGATGCDSKGFSYRSMIHPTPAFKVFVPARSKRIDIILRPVHSQRHVHISLDGQRLGSVALESDWQQLSMEIPSKLRGDAVLRFEFTGKKGMLVEGPRMPKDVLALLHTIRFNTNPAQSAQTVDAPIATEDVIWLERGQLIELPLPMAPGQAIETSDIELLGDPKDLLITVELSSTLGNVEHIASFPAALRMPWNLSLSPRAERSPVYLRLRATGKGSARFGLQAPRLTRPAKDTTAPNPTEMNWRNVILIAIPGLTMADAQTVKLDVAEAQLFSQVWTTSLELRSALASLFTGLYPHTHQLLQPGKSLPNGTKTLAQWMSEAGRSTYGYLGTIPFEENDPLWKSFHHLKRTSQGAFVPHASELLQELQKTLLRRNSETNPSFHLAVLGDLKVPYLPRTGAWKRYWPEGKKALWSMKESRKRFARIGQGKSAVDTDTAAFIKALRLGKVDEVFSALRQFLLQARQHAPSETAILLVGLGRARSVEPSHTSPDLAHIPIWLLGPRINPEALKATGDLTDVASIITTIADAESLSFGQGRHLLQEPPPAWSEPAFVRLDQSTHFVAMGERLLHVTRDNVNPVLYRQLARPFPGASYEPAQGALIDEKVWVQLMERQLDAWQAAGSSWHEENFSVSTRRVQQKVKYGYQTNCRQ